MQEHVPRSISERRVFVDTSAFLALVDQTDRHSSSAARTLQHLLQAHYRLLTTRYVVVESHAAIMSGVGGDAGRAFLTRMRQGGVAVVPTLAVDESRAEEIVFRHLDKDYSLCDAISFALMERLGLRLAFAFDDHFRQYGWSTPGGHNEWP